MPHLHYLVELSQDLHLHLHEELVTEGFQFEKKSFKFCTVTDFRHAKAKNITPVIIVRHSDIFHVIELYFYPLTAKLICN